MKSMLAPISYKERFDEEGTHYNQTVTLYLDDYELNWINDVINDKKKYITDSVTKSYYKPLKQGLNFTTNTLRDFVAYFFSIEENKRYDSKRNTVFYVKPINGLQVKFRYIRINGERSKITTITLNQNDLNAINESIINSRNISKGMESHYTTLNEGINIVSRETFNLVALKTNHFYDERNKHTTNEGNIIKLIINNKLRVTLKKK